MMHVRKMAAVASVLTALVWVGRASAAETATGTITATPIGGGLNQFNISLTNTSATTSIGTFWFSWIPPIYDFMNLAPTNVTVPTGWTDLIVHDSGEGFSIEAYNVGGAGDQLAPGATGPVHLRQHRNISAVDCGRWRRLGLWGSSMPRRRRLFMRECRKPIRAMSLP